MTAEEEYVPIGDVDPEDAYDAEDPVDERLYVLERVADSIAETYAEPRSGARIDGALASLGRLAEEHHPDREDDVALLVAVLEDLR